MNKPELCCVPRIREQYDKQYTLGVDRGVRNFKGCGVVYIQELPKICDEPIPKTQCNCISNYYDCV